MGARTYFKILFLVVLVSLIILHMQRHEFGISFFKQEFKQTESREKLFDHSPDSMSFDPNYPINPHRICLQRPQIELVICVTVSRSKSEDRQAIRETWGSYARETQNNAVLVFFIGHAEKEESPAIESDILSESNRYQDIVKGDFKDVYYNLTLKSISVVRWVNFYCNHAQFMLKIDSDIYIIIPNLIKRLRVENRTKGSVPFILGNLQAHIKVDRRPRTKWYVTKDEYPQSTYPPYTKGAGYVISRAAYSGITKATFEIEPFVFEDVYITGMCSKRAGVLLIHDNAHYIRNFPTTDVCVIKLLTLAHKYTPEKMRALYKDLARAKC